MLHRKAAAIEALDFRSTRARIDVVMTVERGPKLLAALQRDAAVVDAFICTSCPDERCEL